MTMLMAALVAAAVGDAQNMLRDYNCSMMPEVLPG